MSRRKKRERHQRGKSLKKEKSAGDDVISTTPHLFIEQFEEIGKVKFLLISSLSSSSSSSSSSLLPITSPSLSPLSFSSLRLALLSLEFEGPGKERVDMKLPLEFRDDRMPPLSRVHVFRVTEYEIEEVDDCLTVGYRHDHSDTLLRLP